MGATDPPVLQAEVESWSNAMAEIELPVSLEANGFDSSM